VKILQNAGDEDKRHAQTLADAAETRKVRAACAFEDAQNTQTAWLGAMCRRCSKKNNIHRRGLRAWRGVWQHAYKDKNV